MDLGSINEKIGCQSDVSAFIGAVISDLFQISKILKREIAKKDKCILKIRNIIYINLHITFFL